MKKIFLYVIITLFTSQIIIAQTEINSNNKNIIENQGLKNTEENKNSETRGSYWLPAITGRGIYYDLGFVGIGTDAPSFHLDVDGTIRTTGLILPGGNTGDVLTFGGLGSAYWAAPPNGTSLWTEVGQGIIYNPVGLNTKVGIGVAAPDEKLHVGGTILTEGGLKMLGSTNQIVFGNETSSTFQIARNLATRSTSPPPEGAQVSILNVDANNNVGIGTTNPGVKLDVNGTIRTNDELLVSGKTTTNTLQINSGNCQQDFVVNGKTTTSNLQVNSGSCQQDYVLTATDINGNAIWKDINEMNIGSAWDEDANGNVFIEDGNVGIGTITPESKLDIDFGEQTIGLQFSGEQYSETETYPDFKFLTKLSNVPEFHFKAEGNYTKYIWSCAGHERLSLQMAYYGDPAINKLTFANGTIVSQKMETQSLKIGDSDEITGYTLQADLFGNATWVDLWRRSNIEGSVHISDAVGIGTNVVGNHKLVVAGSINAKEIL
jgi:hypothetical protein